MSIIQSSLPVRGCKYNYVFMKVLWIVNGLFPEAISLLTGQKSEIRSTGGWLSSSAMQLSQNSEIELSVAALSPDAEGLKVFEGECIHYYILPLGKGNKKYNKEYEPIWLQVKELCKPDIVHIHGTEYTHGLAYVNACGPDNVVVSIQGMPSVISDYLYSGIANKEIWCSMSFKDIFRGNLIQYQRHLKKHTKVSEIDLLQKVHYVIGRTSWDKAHTWALNQTLTYFHCNETLREEFYEGVWSYAGCQKHSIFLSQAGRALKGAHQLFKAMPLILRSYPDTHIFIAGDDITKCSTLRDKLRISGYGNYLRKLIKKYGLSNHITFVGSQNADGMKQMYLNANVFVSPSSIENSPNSLCEAQILGVPCVVSFVGGSMDFIPDDRCGILYRFDDVEVLAKAVCDVFEVSFRFDNICMREVALQRHNRLNNKNQLFEIYKSIRDNKI